MAETPASDALFRALADPTRRVILDELAERDGQSLFEICTRLAMRHGIGSSRQAISQHLTLLEAAGLVRTERAGRTKLHHLTTGPLREISRRWQLEGDICAQDQPACMSTTRPRPSAPTCPPASRAHERLTRAR